MYKLGIWLLLLLTNQDGNTIANILYINSERFCTEIIDTLVSFNHDIIFPQFNKYYYIQLFNHGSFLSTPHLIIPLNPYPIAWMIQFHKEITILIHVVHYY